MKKKQSLSAKYKSYKRLDYGGSTATGQDAEDAVLGKNAAAVSGTNGFLGNASIYGTAASLGSGLIDAVAPPDQYGYQGGAATIGKSTLSGAAAGAAAGSVIPGLGTGVGAAVGAGAGAIMGVIKNGKIKRQEATAKKNFEQQNLQYQQAVSQGLSTNPSLITGRQGSTYFRNGGLLEHDNQNDMSTPLYLRYKKAASGGYIPWATQGDTFINYHSAAAGGSIGDPVPPAPVIMPTGSVDYQKGKITTANNAAISLNSHYKPRINSDGAVYSQDGQRMLGYATPGNFSPNVKGSLTPEDRAFLHMMTVSPNSNPTMNSWNDATTGKGNIKVGLWLAGKDSVGYRNGGALTGTGGASMNPAPVSIPGTFKGVPERAPRAGGMNANNTNTPAVGNRGLAKYNITKQPIRRMRDGMSASMVGRQQNPIFRTGGDLSAPGHSIPTGTPGRPKEPGSHPYVLKMGMLETGGRFVNDGAVEHFKDGGPMIKPSHRGKFTAWAKAHHMSVGAATSKVLAHKDSYSGGVVKMANFSRNFGGHATGGHMDGAGDMSSTGTKGNPGEPLMSPYYWAVNRRGGYLAAGGNMNPNTSMGKGTAYDLGTPGVEDNPLTKRFMSGGVATPLSSNNTQFEGQSHEQGGIKIPSLGAETEGGETTKDNYVYSKELGFAALHKPIATMKGKIEKKPQTPDRVNAMQRLNAREDKLQMAQEFIKQQRGIK